MRSRLRGTATKTTSIEAAAAGSLLVLCLACADEGPAPPVLTDLSTPDTNTAVVVLTVAAPGADIPIGEERVYVVDQGRIPHVTLGRHVSGSDTALITFVVSDLYATGAVLTDGSVNRFAWRSPAGVEFTPVTPCTLTVTSAYTLGSPSVQAVETACRVAGPRGEAATVLAKARRYLPLGGSGSGDE